MGKERFKEFPAIELIYSHFPSLGREVKDALVLQKQKRAFV
jgi:hypothetical protein